MGYMINQVWPILHVFSQSSHNQRSEMRKDVCTGDGRHWLPVGLVVYQREVRKN